MSSTKLELLRIAIRNEDLPLSERKQAAEHYIAALIDAIREPAETDPEVIAVRTPPNGDGVLGQLHLDAWKVWNETQAWERDGATLAQSKRHVHDRLKLRALLSVIVDNNAHRLERLEACRRVLEDHLHPQSFYRKNGYDAEKMLSKVLRANATKYGGWNKPPVPVERPPQTFSDVW